MDVLSVRMRWLWVLLSLVAVGCAASLESDEPVPDRPIQLVKPDDTHHRLVVVDENIKYLHQIKPPLAIVAVVGKFHSGKSFLMNQLMGKKNGFGIGPSVQPETMGIWMWGKPARMKTPGGDQELSVIFLDTEGFAANNVTENYDAKVFAVATMLSSHLLYNSVKIIDQADIDYLELLARRTQLFALRSQMSRSKWVANFNEDLLSFPPLTWVVQDFFQSVLEGESPRDWLHRLMKTHARENDQYEISILDIFRQVDCHTLFLPAIRRELLNDLSKAREEELTEEYRDERDALVMKLKKQLRPKVKGKNPIGGAEVSHLLRVLVTAANDGSLADVPSRWDAFVERLQLTAVEDCLKFYEEEIRTLTVEEGQGNPIKKSQLIDWHNGTAQKSVELINHLLQGLDETLKLGIEQLKHRIDISFERTREMNEKKIKLLIGQIKDGASIKAEEALNKIVFPVATQKFHKEADKHTKAVEEAAHASIEKLLEPKEIHPEVQIIQKNLALLKSNYELKNQKAMQAYFQNSINEAQQTFTIVVNTDWNKSTPQLPHILEKVKEQAVNRALAVFSTAVEEFKQESEFDKNKALLREKLRDSCEAVDKENSEIAGKYIRRVMVGLQEDFVERTSGEKIPLPVFDESLDKSLRTEIDRSLHSFEEKLGQYAQYDVYLGAVQEFKTKLAATCELRRRQNIDAFTREVNQPLEQAKRIVLVSADKYSTVFSLKQYIRNVCLINLDEGKPKTWPLELKLQIINNFVDNDTELSSLVKSKEGLWSTIYGFIEWILWMLGFIK